MNVRESTSELASEFWMELPDISAYVDIHGSTVVPNLQMKQILLYFKSNNKEFESKYKEMYEQSPAHACVPFVFGQLTTINDETGHQIECATRGHSTNTTWMKELQKQITASKFGLVCRSKTNLDKVANSMLYPNDFTSRAVQRGIKYEPVALEKFQLVMGLKTYSCGLFVDKVNQWLWGSPDAVIDDRTIVEIKCPLSAKDNYISSATISYLMGEDSELRLNPRNDYYYQVHGQLKCTGAELCYFCVFTLKDFKILKIHRDENFIEEMIKTLKSFYEGHFRKALVEKYVFRPYNKHF